MMTTATETEETPEKKPRKPRVSTFKAHVSPKMWAEAEVLWELGEVTQDDLAKKLKVSRQSIYVHMRKVGAKHGSRAEEGKRKVAEEVARAAVDDATVIASRIRETKEDHYKMSMGLAKLAWNEVLVAQRNSAPISTAMNNLKAIDAAITVISKARNERWAVLGLDRTDHVDEDGLPELVISELTAEQIQTLRDRDHTEIEDMPDIEIQDGDISEDD